MKKSKFSKTKKKVKKAKPKILKKKKIVKKKPEKEIKIKKKKIVKLKVPKPQKSVVEKKSRGFFGFLRRSKKEESKPVIKKQELKSFNKKIDIKHITPPKAKEKEVEEIKEKEIKKEKSMKHLKSLKPLKIPFIKKSPPIKRVHIEKEEFIKTGIPGFDVLLGEGIPKGHAVLVEGGPGSGKTVFCLSLAKYICEKGKKVLYMSFEEPADRLKNHMGKFGAKVEEYEKKGLIYIKRFNALDIARSVEALLSEAKKELLIEVQPVLIPKDFEPDVVLLDSLSSIASAFSGEESRFRIYMEQLFRYLESHNMTSFLIRETSNPTHTGYAFTEKGEAVSFLSDGIIVLYNVFYPSGFRKRAVEVLKMRGVDIQRKIVECDIQKNKGIIVYPNKMINGKYILT